jgi:REP element-mobilizing transposase RayT
MTDSFSNPYRKLSPRYNDAGHTHALMFSCFRRQPFLSKDRSRQWMVDAIQRARETHRFHLWAWVIMPEHVHLLICPTTPGGACVNARLIGPGRAPGNGRIQERRS